MLVLLGVRNHWVVQGGFGGSLALDAIGVKFAVGSAADY
jgi:hypothetical protein